MKVKELIKRLQELNEDAYVHIQTDKRFEEDILFVTGYETEDFDVVVLTNQLVK